MENRSDLKTQAPVLIYQKPWEFKLKGNFGLDAGNYERISLNTGATWYQNFGDIAYYVDGDYLYQSLAWETIRHRGRGTARGDFTVHRFSETTKLDIGLFASGLYDDLLHLDLRLAAGVGPWLDYASDAISNGLSLYLTEEFEKFQPFCSAGASGVEQCWNFSDETALRPSIRNIVIVPFGESSRFQLDAYFTPKIDEFRDYRASATTSIEVGVTDLLSLSVSGSYEYDSRPKPGVKKYDIGVLAGLILAFGAKEEPAEEKGTEE